MSARQHMRRSVNPKQAFDKQMQGNCIFEVNESP